MTISAPTSQPAPTGAPAPTVDGPPAEVVVRRDHRGIVRGLVVALAGASVLLFWVPALIVLIRREPGYFKTGIVWTALIATVVLIVLGAGLMMLWLRTGSRRGPLMTLSERGVQIPAGRRQDSLDVRWEDLELVRLVGHRDPEMAFYRKTEPPTEPEPQPRTDLDLSEPEFLRPLDFANDPPPPMRLPDRAVFEQITPLPEDEEQPPQREPEPRISGPERLYATPYVVPVGRTEPALREVIRAVRRLAAGRVPLG